MRILRCGDGVNNMVCDGESIVVGLLNKTIEVYDRASLKKVILVEIWNFEGRENVLTTGLDSDWPRGSRLECGHEQGVHSVRLMGLQVQRKTFEVMKVNCFSLVFVFGTGVRERSYFSTLIHMEGRKISQRKCSMLLYWVDISNGSWIVCGDGGVSVDDADYIFIRLTNGFCKCKKIMTNDVKSGTTQTHFIIHCCCLLQSFFRNFLL